MRKAFSFCLLFCAVLPRESAAQIFNKDSSLVLSGYVDGYYAYYTDSAGVGNFQKFPTTSPRSNSFSLNIAMISLKYNREKVRAAIGLHYGDIPLSTWSNTYNYIQEAYAGVRLGKKIWLDGGFFRTHIGAEGLLPRENIASSVTISTYNQPYYEAGFRLNFKPTAKLTIDLYALNGYNIFQENNDKKSGGLLVAYAFNDNFNIASSNYFGDDAPEDDVVSRFRFYNNVFLNYQKRKFKMQVAADFANQSHSDTNNVKAATIFSGFATFRYQVQKKTGLYVRGEFFSDSDGFLGGTFVDNKNRITGLKAGGVTAGVEYKPTDNSYLRLESRRLQTEKNQEIFRWDGKNENRRMEIMFHLGCYF